MRGGVVAVKSRRSGSAAAELEHLALVLDVLRGAEDALAELAVRLAIDLHRMLVLDDVARGRIDLDRAARTARLPTLHRIHHLGAVAEVAVELLHGVED